MILDALLAILCIIAGIRGWRKGLLWALCSFIAIFLSILIALKLSHGMSELLFEKGILSGSYTFLLCFIILFLISMLLFRLLVRFVEKILDSVMLGWVNHVTGALLYAFFVVFLFSVVFWVAGSSGLLKEEMKRESKTYHFVEPVAPATIETVTRYLPFFRSLYADMHEYFECTGSNKDKRAASK